MKLPATVCAILFSALTYAQMINDRTETNCNNESRSVYDVAATGVPIIVASKGFDCSICVSQADEVGEFATENIGTIQVWGAMIYTYASTTPDCNAVETWSTTYNWDNVFSFPDVDGYWTSFGTPFYTVIDPNTLETVYEGPSFGNATAFAEALAPLSASSIILDDEFLIYTNREKVNIHFGSQESSAATLAIYNIVGQKIKEFPIQIISGRNEFILPFQAINGIYIATITSNGEHFSTKFVNQN